MPRTARHAPGGLVYHALNRAVARLPFFEKEADYAAFEQILQQAQNLHPTRILAYCLMPNHWHFVLWPREDDELTAFLRWLTNTHAVRWHASHHTVGTGHLYQGRFKAFPVQTERYFYSAMRYVEQNPVRARLATRVEQWRFSSAWRRQHANPQVKALLSEWPLEMPPDWLDIINEPLSDVELEALRLAVKRNRPYGDELWQLDVASRLGLEHTLRVSNRPKQREGGRTS